MSESGLRGFFEREGEEKVRLLDRSNVLIVRRVSEVPFFFTRMITGIHSGTMTRTCESRFSPFLTVLVTAQYGSSMRSIAGSSIRRPYLPTTPGTYLPVTLVRSQGTFVRVIQLPYHTILIVSLTPHRQNNLAPGPHI